MARRLRILAGPNGSGKSSVYSNLERSGGFNWGIYINADEIEKQLKENGFVDVSTFGLTHFAWDVFIRNYDSFVQDKHGLCSGKYLRYIDNKIFVWNTDLVDSYLACYIAEYLRQAVLETVKDITFTIETVMSHPGKLEFMRQAKGKGFRIYLYFVSTSSPDINVGRVAARVQRGGHNVSEEKIRSRYIRSLENLHEAVLLSDRAYIFDNSKNKYRLIAEYDGSTGNLSYASDEIPQWVAQYI